MDGEGRRRARTHLAIEGADDKVQHPVARDVVDQRHAVDVLADVDAFGAPQAACACCMRSYKERL